MIIILLLLLLLTSYSIKVRLMETEINFNVIFNIKKIHNIKSIIFSSYLGVNYKTFSRKYNIWIKNNNNFIYKPNGGHNKIFNDKEEKDIFNEILNRINNYEFVDNDTIKILAEEKFKEKNNVKQFKASNGWLHRFKKKFNLISKGYKIRNAKEITQEQLIEFYGKCKLLEKKYNKNRIFNMDETYNLLIPNYKSLVSLRRKKRYYKQIGNVKEGYTATYIISASGIFLPPVITLKGKTKKVFKKISSIDSTKIINTFSRTGWITESIMISILNKIKIYTNNEKCVLILDNYSIHKTENVINYAKKLNIELFFIPPNMTHKLQPLDVKINGIIKPLMRKNNKLNLIKNVYRKNTYESSINLLLSSVETIREKTIISAFKEALDFTY